MIPKDVIDLVINPGLGCLNSSMASIPAKAMLIAIGLQESRFTSRKQIGGPARGWFQFEKNGGVKGVLTHQYTRPIVLPILSRMSINADVDTCYEAIAWCDPLAVVFARLLLWTVPDDLPGEQEYDESWRQYISAWRPGWPHRETWNSFYDQAWKLML